MKFGNILYKKQDIRDVLNYRYSEIAINQKKIDTILNHITLSFGIQLDTSKKGEIQSLQQINKLLKKILLIQNKPVFLPENNNVLDNIDELIIEWDVKSYLYEKGRSSIVKGQLKNDGYSSNTAYYVDALTGIAVKILKYYKHLDAMNYPGIKNPTKAAIDNIQKIIDIILVND